jgi:hypothetical protein
MAISFVEALEGSANNGTDVDIPFVNAQSGDFVLVMGGHQRSGSNAGVGTSGYTENVDYTSQNRFSVSYKFISADTGVTCLGSGNAADGAAYIAFVFRGVDTSTPIDATTTNAENSGGIDPNSPSITTVTDGAAVVSAFLLNEDILANLGPTGYSNTSVKQSGDTNRVTAGAAWKAKATAGAENPSAWTMSGGATQAWKAATIAIRPAAAGVITDGVFSATGEVSVSLVGVYEAAGPFSMTGTGTASFGGDTLISSPATMNGSGTTVSFVGASLAEVGAFSMTGTITPVMAGFIASAGSLSATGTGAAEFGSSPIYSIVTSMTGTVTPFFVGATTKLSHVREVVESRGAATVTIS